MSFAYYISSNKIGSNDRQLGEKLIYSFFMRLIQAAEKPTHMLFLERGVRLLLPEFSAIDALKILHSEYGVELLACSTCLEFYGIENDIEAGRISSMAEILQVMHQSDKVIHI